MDKKVAFVTGSAGGIGRIIALTLAKQGYNLVINDLNAEKLSAVEKEIKDLGADCLSLAFDVSNEEAVKKAFVSVKAHYGKLDVMVNNAGICPIRKIDEVSSKQMEKSFAINVGSMFLCAKEAAKMMKEQGSGNIINACSQSGFRETPVTFEYTTTKWAIRGMTKAMAEELKPYHIRVNAYCPGTVITPMQDKIAKQTAKEMHVPAFLVRKVQLKSQALGRFQTMEDMANLVAFLASDASRDIDGQNILCNGGQVMN